MQTKSVKLSKSKQLTEDVFHYEFSYEEAGPEFKPGQFFMLKIEDEQGSVNRAYSVASPPSTEGFSLCIKLIPGGRGSEYLRTKKEGDMLTMMGPFGHFYLRDEAEKDIVMISTGTGLAPFMSMLPILFEQGFKRPITLLHGVRHESDLFYVDQLREWEEQHENFTAVVSLSRPDESWDGVSGRVTDHFENLPLDPEATKVYICGNGAMVKDIRDQALELGMDKKAIHLEQFTPM